MMISAQRGNQDISVNSDRMRLDKTVNYSVAFLQATGTNSTSFICKERSGVKKLSSLFR